MTDKLLNSLQVFNTPGEYIFNRDRIPPAESALIWAIAFAVIFFVAAFGILPLISVITDLINKNREKKRKKKAEHISSKCRTILRQKESGYSVVVYHGSKLSDLPTKASLWIKRLMIYENNTLAYIDMEDNFRTIKEWIRYEVKERPGTSSSVTPEDLKLHQEDKWP